MSTLQLTEAVALARRHTDDPAKVGRAVSIMWGESGLDTSARCFNVRGRDGRVTCSSSSSGTVLSVDRGIWQINSKAHPTVSDAEADNPVTATAYAHKLSHGFTDFGPWVASRASGQRGEQIRRIRRMAEAEARAQRDAGKSVTGAVAGAVVGGALGPAGIPVGAALGANADGAGAVVGGVVDAVTSVPQFLAMLADRDTWIRVVKVLAGVVAVVAGGFLLNRDLITQVAGSIVTGGAGGAAAAATAAAAAA